MLSLCLTHCLGWDPSQANHWVPSPAHRQTPLQADTATLQRHFAHNSTIQLDPPQAASSDVTCYGGRECVARLSTRIAH